MLPALCVLSLLLIIHEQLNVSFPRARTKLGGLVDKGQSSTYMYCSRKGQMFVSLFAENVGLRAAFVYIYGTPTHISMTKLDRPTDESISR